MWRVVLIALPTLVTALLYRCENDEVLIVQNFGNDTIRMHCQRLDMCGYQNLRCDYDDFQPQCGGLMNFVAHVVQSTPTSPVEHTCCNLFNPRLPHTIPTHVGNDCFIYELPDGSSHTEPVTFNDQPPLTILKNAAEIPEHIGVSGYRLRLYLLKNKSPPTLLVKGIERRLWSTWARNVWGDAAKSQNRRRVDGVQSKAADPSSSLPSGQGVPNIHVHVNASGNNNNVISGNNGRENTVPGHINITIHTGENRQSIGNGANSIKDEKNISESEAGTRDGEGSKSGSDGSGRSEAVGKKGKIMRKESGEAGSEAGKESRKNSENPGDFRSGDGNGNSNGDSDGVRGVGSRTFTVRNGDGIDGSGDPRVEAKGGGSSAADVQSGNGGENAVSPIINGAGRAKIGDRAEGVGPKKGENHSGNGAEPSERVKLKNSSISRKEKGKDSLSAEDGMDRNDLLRGGSMRSVSIGILDGSDKSKGADGKPRFEGMKGQNGHIGKTLSRQASVTDHPSETIIEQTTKRTIESSKRKSTLLNSKLGVTSTPDMLTTSRSTDAAIVSVEGTTARTSTNRTTKKKSKTTEDDSKVGKLSKEAGKANGGLSPTTSSGLKSGKTVSSKASHSMGGTISNKSTNVYGRNATKPIQESAEMTTLKSKTVSSSVSTNTTLKASLGGGLGASSGNHSSISSALENAKATIKPPSNSSTIPVDKKAASIRVAAPSARARLAAAPSKKAADPKAEKAMKRLKRMNCFPADALVTTTTGRKRMDQLAVGDFYVLVPSTTNVLKYERVEMFYHREPETRTQFVVLITESMKRLALTPLHLLPFGECESMKRALANADGVEQWLRASRFADKVSVGDCVMTVGDNGKMFTERIIKVGRQISEGIYSPMTVTGSLLVDDVLSSCFSQVESHTVQKIVFDFFVYVREAFGLHSEHSVERKGIPPFITYVYELSHIILPFSNF
ncbi:hypothetical protein Angca_004156 [Angiostrongylus cantonensis]|nr:hypothetical protein Angca_004156 [Angiostrongylus cantonensis]